MLVTGSPNWVLPTVLVSPVSICIPHPFLILFSSFPKDVTLPPNLKLTGMENTSSLIEEIVVTGFGDTQTAFLAQATLARLQRELRMAKDDVAMVLREADGRILCSRSYFATLAVTSLRHSGAR